MWRVSFFSPLVKRSPIFSLPTPVFFPGPMPSVSLCSIPITDLSIPFFHVGAFPPPSSPLPAIFVFSFSPERTLPLFSWFFRWRWGKTPARCRPVLDGRWALRFFFLLASGSGTDFFFTVDWVCFFLPPSSLFYDDRHAECKPHARDGKSDPCPTLFPLSSSNLPHAHCVLSTRCFWLFFFPAWINFFYSFAVKSRD